MFFVFDFPHGFGEGNFFKSFTSKTCVFVIKVQLCVVLKYSKFVFLFEYSGIDIGKY